MNNNNTYTLNGVEMAVVYDENAEYTDAYSPCLVSPYGNEYYFYPPDEENPTQTILFYYGNTPVKVKMSQDLIVKYYDYSLGIERDTTIDDYLARSASSTGFRGIQAEIKDNQLVHLYIPYNQ